MKKLKKLASIALAAVMALALAAPAFAAEGPATSGSIKIVKTEKDATYNVYRIFDATVSGENVSYTISEKWESFFTADGAGYIVNEVPEDKDYNPITVGSETRYIAIDDDNVVEFADDALDYALEAKIEADETITGTGEDVTVSDMPFGYYMTYMVGSSERTADSNGSICSLTPVSGEATLKIKATTPTIEKTSGGNKEVSADVGNQVPFTIAGKVPDTSNFESYTYEVADHMDNGLTFDKNVTVTIADNDVTDACTYTEDGNGFTLSIPVMNYQANVGEDIVISYSATVNEDAVTVDAQKNSATLTYSNDPTDGSKTVPTTPEIVEVYTSRIVINKTNSANAPLPGATFVLKNEDGKYYNLTAGVVTWVDTEDAATKITSGEDGVVEFKGLKDDTYYVEETEAPAGYNKLASDVEITVDGTKKDYKVVDGVNVKWNPEVDEAPGSEAVKADGQVRFLTVTEPVVNLTGAELPETGGIGTTLFYTMGGLLVVGAGILLVTKKRMGA